MFEKLLSNLPFNPSLIGQVSFYAKKLKQESSVRRLGFILVALTLFLQLFAVFSPAQPTLAREGNDIVPGGFSSKLQAIQKCQNNEADFATILMHFAISCNNLINNSVVTTIRSTDYNNQLYSMGRQPQGPVNQTTGKATDEVPVLIGSTNFYMRKLSSWDSWAYSSYTAISVGNAFAVQYFILYGCGNIVSIGKPAPPPPPPAPKPAPTPTPPPAPKPKPTKSCPEATTVEDTLSCLRYSKQAQNVTQNISDANGTTAKAGDTIQYTLFVKNTGKATVSNFVIQENLSDVLEYADITEIGDAQKNDNNVLVWPAIDIKGGDTVKKSFSVRVKDPIPQTPRPCPAGVNPCPASSSFDLTMTNVYGNTVNIHLPPTVKKTTEKITTTTLPNTGPGSNMIIGFSLFAIVGYFFARSRLLAKEIEIAKNEYASGGGI